VNLQDFLTHLSSQPAWAEAGQVTPLGIDAGVVVQKTAPDTAAGNP
jgi:hypothetical protein